MEYTQHEALLISTHFLSSFISYACSYPSAACKASWSETCTGYTSTGITVGTLVKENIELSGLTHGLLNSQAASL